MIATSLNVPEQVYKNVEEYLAKHLSGYKLIAVGQPYGLDTYIVLGLRNDGKYATWTCWNDMEKSLDYGHYDLTEARAMSIFMDKYIIKSKRPAEDRLDDIATKCMHHMLEEDYDDAMEFLRDEIDLSEDECEYFEVDYEEMQEA